MKLWLLRPVENLPQGDDPWEPWYDKAFGFVVRAKNEQEARELANSDAGRELANSDAGDEKRGEFLGRKTADTNSPWLDPKYSTCVELTAKGESGIVIKDFAAA